MFGVPSIQVGDTFYWGADRLHFVARDAGCESLDPEEPYPADTPPNLDFFHDFSSPFSYLASTQIERIAKAHGADEGVDYSAVDLKKELERLTVPTGVDVLYDCVGGDAAEPSLRAMAWEGRYLAVGFASGQIPRIPLNLVLLKGCEIVGVFWTSFVEREPETHRANTAQILQWCNEGKIVPHIHETFPLAETAKALALIEGRKVTGKVVVHPQD